MTIQLSRPAEGHPLVVMPTWYDDEGNHLYPRAMKESLDSVPRDQWPKFWPTCPALEALETPWLDDRKTTDAHTVQYTIEGEAEFPRLAKRYPEAAEWLESRGGRVWMVALFLDQDLPGHAKADTMTKDDLRAWWEPKLAGLLSSPLGQKAGWYRTAGGVRWVWLLDPWVSPRIWPAVFGRVREEMSRVLCTSDGDRIDDTKDWTRLMRLPRVTRQGAELRFKMDLSRMTPVDVVEELGTTERDLLEDSVRRESVRVTPKTERKGRPPVRVAQDEADEECIRIARQELDTLVGKVGRQKKKGDRNGLLYWAGVRLGEVVEWLDREVAEDALARAAVDAGLQGGDREAEATVRSGVECGLRDPRDLRREWLEHAVTMEALMVAGRRP